MHAYIHAWTGKVKPFQGFEFGLALGAHGTLLVRDDLRFELALACAPVELAVQVFEVRFDPRAVALEAARHLFTKRLRLRDCRMFSLTQGQRGQLLRQVERPVPLDQRRRVSSTSDLRVRDAQRWAEWIGPAKPTNAPVVAVCNVRIVASPPSQTCSTWSV